MATTDGMAAASTAAGGDAEARASKAEERVAELEHSFTTETSNANARADARVAEAERLCAAAIETATASADARVASAETAAMARRQADESKISRLTAADADARARLEVIRAAAAAADAKTAAPRPQQRDTSWVPLR